MDYRNRFYSQRHGRFLQTHPIRFEGNDINLMRYASNMPSQNTDPYGLQDGQQRNPNACGLDPDCESECYDNYLDCMEGAGPDAVISSAAGAITGTATADHHQTPNGQPRMLNNPATRTLTGYSKNLIRGGVLGALLGAGAHAMIQHAECGSALAGCLEGCSNVGPPGPRTTR